MRRFLTSKPHKWSRRFSSSTAIPSPSPYIYNEEVQRSFQGHGGPRNNIVALESTIISHGMPYPQNVETALEVERIVREQGATPATIAILDGRIHVGLTEAELEKLGTAENVRKCSRRDIAYTMATKSHGATTVASTMMVAHRNGIRTFVTGGIGGVHREYDETMDMSADLTELSRTPVTVICAGVKSILDIPKTLEVLETYGVAVGGWQCNEFPAFFSNDSGVQCPLVFNNEHEVAETMIAADTLSQESGMLLGVPNPHPADPKVINEAVSTSLAEASCRNIHGKDITPYILKRVNEISEGAALRSNIELVKNNALVGGKVASAYSKSRPGHSSREFCTAAKLEVPERSSRLPTYYPIVFGGAVVDMTSRPHDGIQFRYGTSNPGYLQQSFGGVASNISVALSKLGHYPAFVTAFGDDQFAHSIRNHLKAQNLELFNALDLTTCVEKDRNLRRSAVYSAMLDENGQLVGAVADMSCFEQVSSDAISLFQHRFSHGSMVIVDGNFSQASLDTICNSSASIAQLDMVKQLLSVMERDGSINNQNMSQLRTCLDFSLSPENRMARVDKVTESSTFESCAIDSLDIRNGVPVWFEPTSVEKAKRIASFDTLCKVSVVSPNADEVLAMAEALELDLEEGSVESEESSDENTSQDESSVESVEEFAKRHNLDTSAIDVDGIRKSLDSEDAKTKMEQAGVTREEIEAVLEQYTRHNAGEKTASLVDPDAKHTDPRKTRKEHKRETTKKSRRKAPVPDAWKDPKRRLPVNTRSMQSSCEPRNVSTEGQYTAVTTEKDFRTNNTKTSVHHGYSGDLEDKEMDEIPPSALDPDILEAGKKVLAAMCNPISEELLVGTVDGMKHVFITLGEEGVLWLSAPPCKDEDKFWDMYSASFFQGSIETGFDFSLFKPPSAELRSCTGAGDCFVAGTVHALCQGELIDEAIMYGLGAAKCAVECEESVPVDLTQEKVHKAYMQAKTENSDQLEDVRSESTGKQSTDQWSSLASMLLKPKEGSTSHEKSDMEHLEGKIAGAMAKDAIDENDAGVGLYNMMEDIEMNTSNQVAQFREYREQSHTSSHYNARHIGKKS